MDSVPIVRVYRGEEIIREVKLDGPVLTIGRSNKVDITLDSDGVSRRHAELALNLQGQWVIRDLYSQNGTKVNGDYIVDLEHVLEVGDSIEIDEFRLLYRM